MSPDVRRVTFRNGSQSALAAAAEALQHAGEAGPALGAGGGPPLNDPADLSGGWRPAVAVGAPAPGGLTLPAAHPTASWLYAPRGVHLGEVDGQEVLVVADTGNHRVLLWFGLPETDGQPCDLVLGQPDATTEGPAAGCGDTRTGMFLPTGVLVHEGRLIVADAWHHRLLIYAQVPRTPGAVPDLVLGQPDLDSVEPNAGQAGAAAGTLYWPFGLAVIAGTFWVADTGNRRVLGWSGGVPETAIEPDVVLGQSGMLARDENRGASPAADSFRWPHDVTGTADLFLVADAGNHRVLGWPAPPAGDAPATLVLGQPSFDSAREWPYGPQNAAGMRFPYAADLDGGRLAVADTANNRVLLWDTLPSARPGENLLPPEPSAVLGQPSFSANGENHWTGVEPDSLCWPYGLSLRGDCLAIADSGNNRVVLWRR